MGGPTESNRVVGIEPGAAEIRKLASARDRNPVVVGITGAVASGKSTLAVRVGGCVVPTDSYLPDYDGIPEAERDLPRHADIELLAQHLDELRANGRAMIPVWSFKTHRREGCRELAVRGGLIVVEGIHALDERVMDRLDVRVLVEASAPARWERWEAIEAAGERGWGVERARRYFDLVAEPTFAARAARLRAIADIVVWNGRDGECQPGP